MKQPEKIAVIGLGYVGLPLAVALARHYAVSGFDKNAGRIAELKAGLDSTREVDSDELAQSQVVFSDEPSVMQGADMFIVTVPTPVTETHEPDLGAVRAAAKSVGALIRAGATAVLESTVYPGVTEEVFGAIIAERSGLIAGVDFMLGYSPERMNPGDRDHGLAELTKVVAAPTQPVADMLATVYGKVTNGNVFVAKDIRTAEAAKVIENAQRDINIAFVNEVAMISGKLGLSVYDVLAAARTKWNFLPFTPGLVGGHCIGVDPYYLAHKAQEIGHDPEILLAGRRINDAMGDYVADSVDKLLPRGAQVLMLGLTFKENVPDLRNTRVVDIIQGLTSRGHSVAVHDPLADAAEAKAEYGVELLSGIDQAKGFDAVFGAVSHDVYERLGAEDLMKLIKPGGVVADIKGMWRSLELPDGPAGYRRWTL